MNQARHIFVGLLCAAIVSGCADNGFESAVSNVDPDGGLGLGSIHNSVYHPYQGIWFPLGHQGEGFQDVVLLEEYDYINVSEGWDKRNLTLTCWLHKDAKFAQKLFEIERDASCGVRWELDRNGHTIKLWSYNDTDGSATTVETLDLWTGEFTADSGIQQAEEGNGDQTPPAVVD